MLQMQGQGWGGGGGGGGEAALYLIPGQGTKSYVLQLRVCMLQQKIPFAVMKIEDPTCHN